MTDHDECENDMVLCEECQGSGFEYECSGHPDHDRKMIGPCPECDGLGYVDE